MIRDRSELRPSAFRPVPRTGVIYVTTEAARRGYDPRRSRLVQPRPGQPETGPLPGAPPRVRERSTSIPRDQEYAPVAGLWELREAIAELYNRLYRRGMPAAVHRRERGHLRRRPRRADPRGRRARPHQPRPLPARLHRLRGAARRLPRLHADPDPARGASAATRSRADDLRARCMGRGLGAVLVSNPCNPTGKRRRRRRARGVGRGPAASSTARCSSTSSTRTTSGGRPAARRWRARRATSRTSTAIRSSSSTA